MLLFVNVRPLANATEMAKTLKMMKVFVRSYVVTPTYLEIQCILSSTHRTAAMAYEVQCMSNTGLLHLKILGVWKTIKQIMLKIRHLSTLSDNPPFF